MMCLFRVLSITLLMVLSILPIQAESEEKVLRIGITQYPANLNPNIETMVAKSYVLGFVKRPLTAFDADWKNVCMECAVLPTIENGLAVLEQTPDGTNGLAINLEIPADAYWGDGTPVTTEDVKFTFEVGKHPLSGTTAIEGYRQIYKIDIHDAKRYTLHTDRRTFNYNVLYAIYLLPAHLDRPIFENSPAEYKNRTLYDADSTNPGLYSGPYRITETVRGSYITLRRNEFWAGKPPYFDKITIRTVENTSAMEANLLSGNVDMIAGELGLQLDQGISFEKRHGAKFNVIFKPGLHYEHIDLNLENPILSDIRVRRALLHGIDREAISERLFQGRQPVAHGNVNPLDRAYSKNIVKYEYSTDKANALLDEAGWTLRKKGIRHDKTGNALRIELMSTAGDKTRELVEQVIQSQLRQVGVDIRIKNEAPRVFFGQTTRERKFTGMAMYAWVTAPEITPRTTLHSTQIPMPDNNFSGQNYSTFNNPEMDRLIDSVENELDASKRLPIWDRIQEIYTTELPVLPLFYRANTHVLPKWLTGVVPTGHLNNSSLWAENWSRKE
jgi:peptide/nickel transport system substrate-binding protein